VHCAGHDCFSQVETSLAQVWQAIDSAPWQEAWQVVSPTAQAQ
jgi:hypothetical protein